MDIEHLVENLGRDFLDFPAQSPNTRVIDKNINLTDRKPTAKIVDIYDVGNETLACRPVSITCWAVSAARSELTWTMMSAPRSAIKTAWLRPNPPGTSNQHSFVF